MIRDMPDDTVTDLRRHAMQGAADAQYNLALRYSTGQGVPANAEEAAAWCQRAAQQGHARAQCQLGLMYAKGDGVPKNVGEAVKWWHAASRQGNRTAQLALGLSYENGTGVVKNDGQAVAWYRIAAESGEAAARFRLGLMYARGKGVAENYIHGYAWLNLASAQGLEAARKQKARLRTQMTVEQVARAQEISGDLLKHMEASANHVKQSTDRDGRMSGIESSKASQAIRRTFLRIPQDYVRTVVSTMRRVWSHRMGPAACVLAMCGLSLMAFQIDRQLDVRAAEAEESRRLERLEQLLWQQSGASRIASALQQLEMMELTGTIDPQRAAATRQRIEQVQADLRQRVHALALEMLQRPQPSADSASVVPPDMRREAIETMLQLQEDAD